MSIIKKDALEKTIRAIVAAGGSDAREAKIVAENLVTANLTGVSEVLSNTAGKVTVPVAESKDTPGGSGPVGGVTPAEGENPAAAESKVSPAGSGSVSTPP